MHVTYTTNSWGSVMGSSAAMNNVNSAYYIATGPLGEAIHKIGEAGFDSVEIFDGNLLAYENREAELRELMAGSGVTLMGAYCAANFIYEEILNEELYRIEKAAAFASRLGAKYLVVGGGATRFDGSRESDYTRMGAALDRVCALCDKLDMTAVYHPHMGSLVQSLEEIDKLMPQTRMSLCPDTGHIVLAGSDPVAVIRKYAARIPYVHLKDVTDSGVFCPLGMGTVNITGAIRAFQDAGMSPQYAVECDGWPGDAFDGAVRTNRYLKQSL